MKKLAIACWAATWLITVTGSAFIAWLWRGMVCAIEHRGASAPANVVLIFAPPFIIAAALSAVAGFILWNHKGHEEDE